MIRRHKGNKIETYPLPLDEKENGKEIVEMLGSTHAYHTGVGKIYKIKSCYYAKGRLQVDLETSDKFVFTCLGSLLEVVVEHR